MARVLFALISLVCTFQSLAAPLRRAVTTPDCSKANGVIFIQIDEAQGSLGSIDTANQLFNAPFLLQAQLSLLDARNGSTQIADSLLKGEAPAPADANARILAGLQAAQASLNQTFFFANETATADALSVKAANKSIATALASAQQAVDINCTTAAD
ncbi:hypothetical protein FB451DRAFT_1167985 [Mycena latifolia]|nr:hypothetical protein FB451DRAFT_1167985 [Mycena latifolia]